MQTRDEKCIAFLAFFAKQKATQRIKILKLDICPTTQNTLWNQKKKFENKEKILVKKIKFSYIIYVKKILEDL